MNTPNTTSNTATTDQARNTAGRIAYTSATINAALQHMARKACMTPAGIRAYLSADGSEPGRRYFASLLAAAGIGACLRR